MTIEDLLRDAGVIDDDQRDDYRDRRPAEQYPGQAFVAAGLLTAEKLAGVLSAALDLPLVALAFVELDQESARRLPAGLARRKMVAPIDDGQRREGVLIATADPLDESTAQEVEFALGRPVERVIMSGREVLEALVGLFGASGETTAEALPDEPAEEPDDTPSLESLLGSDDPTEGPVARLVGDVLRQAIEEGTSDVHFEPAVHYLMVRGRIDGMLTELLRIPKYIQDPCLSRLKILASLDIAEKRRPQDGRIRVAIDRRKIDLRVSTMPTYFGEKIVLRVLDPSKTATVDFTSLGFSAEQATTLGQAIGSPQGMILVTGPTGSGKTTTLYAGVNVAKRRRINVVTIEDPIEYQVDGISQVQVDDRIGLTFASALRTVLRQDPDVVLVGEIRDAETAQAAFQAAMTGHLVLSTVHANDTVETVLRLQDLGVDAPTVASALLLVLAQRLIRTICPDCKTTDAPDPATLARLGLPAATPTVRGTGCSACRGSGFRGRIGLYELLALDEGVRQAIAERAPVTALRKAARATGMADLVVSAAAAVAAGRTTADEVLRVVPPGQLAGGPAPAAASPVAPPVAVPEPAPGGEISTPRILVVEDNRSVQILIKKALQQLPFDVEIDTAADGQAGLEKVAATRPDLIVVDVSMPRMDGYEMTRRIRADLETSVIPIVMLTAHDDAESRTKGYRTGADDYVTKPFEGDDLRARVDRLLRRAYGYGESTR